MKVRYWHPPNYLRENRPELAFADPAVLDVVIRHTPGRRVALQAGGHLGIWPAKLAEWFAEVVSFEPVPELYQVCREAIRTRRVTMMPVALSSIDGRVPLRCPTEKRYSGSSMVDPNGYPVPAITIDSLPLSLTTRVDAIVLDIEGHEIEALKGASKTIAYSRPTIVIEENAKSVRVRGDKASMEYMQSIDYRRAAVFRNDWIFVPNERK